MPSPQTSILSELISLNERSLFYQSENGSVQESPSSVI